MLNAETFIGLTACTKWCCKDGLWNETSLNVLRCGFYPPFFMTSSSAVAAHHLKSIHVIPAAA